LATLERRTSNPRTSATDLRTSPEAVEPRIESATIDGRSNVTTLASEKVTRTLRGPSVSMSACGDAVVGRQLWHPARRGSTRAKPTQLRSPRNP
jgi:hypothetical protein